MKQQQAGQLALWQLNLLRVGSFVMVFGLVVTKWPLLLDHASWGLAEGAKECLLIAMSVLALLGLRYPQRMHPILLFEVMWKLLRPAPFSGSSSSSPSSRGVRFLRST